MRVRYQTIEFESLDIHIKSLWDLQEFFDDNSKAKNIGISESMWSLFGIIWDSEIILTNYIDSLDLNHKRVLEVGCGLGLASILLGCKDIDITATDYHPEVESFFRFNSKLNTQNLIPFFQQDWNEKNTRMGKFDVIIGSDLCYQKENAILLSQFISEHADDTCEVIIVDPGRRYMSFFINCMESLSFNHNFKLAPSKNKNINETYKGRIHQFRRKK